MEVLVIHQAYEQEPRPVARVTIPLTIVEAADHQIERALDFAYEKTQNTDGSWSMGIAPDGDPRVVRLAPLHRDSKGKFWGLRSTHIGDRMLIGDRVFQVAGIGFEEVAE